MGADFLVAEATIASIHAAYRARELSAVELVTVEEGALRVRGVDLLDGTPILDIKPYVPYADAFPAARAGWIDAIDAAQGRQSAPGPRKPRTRPRGEDVSGS